MAKAKNICFDRILPRDVARVQRTMMMPDGRQRAIALVGKQWINGSTIKIRFMNGTQDQKDMVERPFIPTRACGSATGSIRSVRSQTLQPAHWLSGFQHLSTKTKKSSGPLCGL